jgi:Raf kinase inhibitor-like YbhB/YbcL family protein
MKSRSAAQLAVAALLVLAGPACSQQAATTPLALADIPAAGQARLKVTSPAFKDGGDIPLANTQYRTNTFPGLAWTGTPPGTRSVAVILQDSDMVFHGAYILHWTLFNVPGSQSSLPVGMTAAPAGAVYGPNYKGPSVAYTGPRTPPGPKHHYHFQVFALDKVLPGDAAATGFAGLTAAMKGHVLASGELVGLGQAPPAGT